MPDLTGKILTIPEIEMALKEYGCNAKVGNALLRKFVAVMSYQIKKTRKQALVEVHNKVADMFDNLDKD